jgi:hypothetical protein
MEDRASTPTSMRRVLRARVAVGIVVLAAAQPAIGDALLDADGEEAAWAAVLALANGAIPPGDVAATPLGREASPAVLLWRTLALYAMRAAAPEVESPALRDRVTRNLAALAHAVEQPDSLRSGDAQRFGALGLTAWVAWLHLLYRSYWDLEADAGEIGERGLGRLEELLARGRAADGVAFAAEHGDGACSPLATALAVLALSQAYENEELVRYEDDAFAAAAACTGDGRDPVVRAYRALALLELVKNSGSTSLRDEARRLLAGAGAAPATLVFARRMLAHLDGEDAGGPVAPLGFRPLRRARRPAAVAPAALRDPELRALFDSVFATLTERVPRRAGTSPGTTAIRPDTRFACSARSAARTRRGR